MIWQRHILAILEFIRAKLLCLPWGIVLIYCCWMISAHAPFAKALGFGMVGTIGILLQAYDAGLISFAEFEESPDDSRIL